MIHPPANYRPAQDSVWYTQATISLNKSEEVGRKDIGAVIPPQTPAYAPTPILQASHHHRFELTEFHKECFHDESKTKNVEMML